MGTMDAMQKSSAVSRVQNEQQASIEGEEIIGERNQFTESLEILLDLPLRPIPEFRPQLLLKDVCTGRLELTDRSNCTLLARNHGLARDKSRTPKPVPVLLGDHRAEACEQLSVGAHLGVIS